jgi:hypothetical protein
VNRLAFVLVVAAALVACSDDDGGDAAVETTAAATTAPISTAPISTAPVSTVDARRDPSDPLCAAASELRQADIDYQVRLAGGVQDALAQQDVAPLNEALTAVDEDGTLGTLLGAYDRLSVQLPPEQQANVARLKAFTEEFFRGVNGLPNFAEIESYMSALREDPEARAANDAGAALDAYVRQECGAGITASG